jgi:DNA-binding response OmpR family regulator
MDKVRVLVVDDDREQRADVVRAISEMGLEAVEAPSEIDAYSLMEAYEFPLAVIDICLADQFEGLKVIKRLRHQQPRCRIIALTTRAGNEIGIQALEAGSDDFVGTKWKYINWPNLLQQRMALWRDVASRASLIES